jgi:hypothetical protein
MRKRAPVQISQGTNRKVPVSHLPLRHPYLTLIGPFAPHYRPSVGFCLPHVRGDVEAAFIETMMNVRCRYIALVIESVAQRS